MAWFSDSAGRFFATRDGGRIWRDMNDGLMGARVQNFVVSTNRTLVLHAQTDKGAYLTRDGGMSWRAVAEDAKPGFSAPDFKRWQKLSDNVAFRINDASELVRSTDGGRTERASMSGWRIPRAYTVFITSQGAIASGPGGCYQSSDGERWTEVKLWREDETGAADFLHAYWMGRYYGFVKKDE